MTTATAPSETTPIAVGAGDQSAGSLGAGVVRPGGGRGDGTVGGHAVMVGAGRPRGARVGTAVALGDPA